MTKQQIIQQGAEAVISLQNNQIIKNRIKKSYRLPEIDEKLRKLRTRSESRIIERLSAIINVPEIIEVDENNKLIIMEFIDGKRLSDNLEKLNWKKLCKQIAEQITKLHNQNIIHGDLTTSNMIYVEKGLINIDNTKQNKESKLEVSKREQSIKEPLPNLKDLNINNKDNFKIYLIDFGLSFHSHKIEDKAVDLHLLKQALNAKHFKIAEQATNIILKNYKPSHYKEILEQLKKVESRGRYKERE